MKKIALIILVLTVASFANEAPKQPAPPTPSPQEQIDSLTKERDVLKQQVEALTKQLNDVVAEANARLLALEAQRAAAVQDAVKARLEAGRPRGNP